MLDKLTKAVEYIEETYCGTIYFPDLKAIAIEFEVDEYKLACAVDEAEIFQCIDCGWTLYPGEYCTMHDHEEIICMDCCEEHN